MMKTHVLGCDEVGYGACFADVVVCGVRALTGWKLNGLKDSKQLTDKQRRKMNDELRILIEAGEITASIQQETAQAIDEKGITHALKSCYKRVAETLYQPDTQIIIDGNMDFAGYLDGFDYSTVVKADTFIPTAMAGSILAKVYRDDLVIKMAAEFPGYDLESCKGYLSTKHLAGLITLGRTIHHRKSYKLKALGEK
jgi:ribonuclease HII